MLFLPHVFEVFAVFSVLFVMSNKFARLIGEHLKAFEIDNKLSDCIRFYQYFFLQTQKY